MDFDGTGMPLSEAAAVGRARLQEVARQRSFRARVGQPLLGNSKLVSVWIIDSNKLDAGLHQRCDEREIARQPIELR